MTRSAPRSPLPEPCSRWCSWARPFSCWRGARCSVMRRGGLRDSVCGSRRCCWRCTRAITSISTAPPRPSCAQFPWRAAPCCCCSRCGRGASCCHSARSEDKKPELFRQTLDGKGAEFCVLVADLADFLEFGRIAVGFICFHAVPDLQGNALLRWCTFNRRYVLSDSKEPATGFLNESLSFRHVLLQIGIKVFHIDFRNNVERRFSLSVYILDRHGAKYEA